MRRVLPALVAAGVMFAPGIAVAWPTVPLPPDSRGEVVTEKMNYNGVEMRASKFDTRQSTDEVEAFYTEAWGEKNVKVTELGNRRIIGHLQRDYSITVDISPGGSGTTGTIGIMRDPGKGRPPQLGRDFYRPSGTQVLSDLTNEDTSPKTRTIVLKNRLSPYANMQLYGTRLQGDGWRGAAVGPCRPASLDCVVNYERPGGERMAMTLSRDETQDTTLVVNIE